THNFWLSLSLSFFMLLYTLIIAEIQADRWSEYFDIKNATVASLHNIEQTIPAILLDPLWNLLGFNKVKLTPKVFKDRLGVFGEPTSLGIILGIIIGI
ncbi:PTS galactitol transporter subunit IIC, partial [Lactobacillus salivarius]|nr:PTS galactitol transporter subunit IIC [Ligilactobacillus salivarius]